MKPDKTQMYKLTNEVYLATPSIQTQENCCETITISVFIEDQEYKIALCLNTIKEYSKFLELQNE